MTTATEPNGTTITVDGLLEGEYVEALDACVKQAIERGSPVRVFLRDVSSIDERGRVLLSQLAGKGVYLRASGLYNSYIVTQISRSATRDNGRRDNTRCNSQRR